MKPLNNKERNSSFLKFLLMFLITIATVLAAVYFNFKIPKTENKMLRDQAMSIEKSQIFQKEFYLNMTSLKGMIDSLEVPGQNISYQNSLIGSKIVEMQKSIPTSDSTHLYDLHTDILQLYVELQETKDRLRSLTNAEKTIEDYKIALDRCSADLKQAERDLFIARGSN